MDLGKQLSVVKILSFLPDPADQDIYPNTTVPQITHSLVQSAGDMRVSPRKVQNPPPGNFLMVASRLLADVSNY